MELARFFGFLHPALVHFPLVLLLLAVGLEAIGWLRRDSRFTWAAQIALLLGTTTTLFAFVAGNFAEIWAARDGVPQDPMEYHELLATITSWTFVFLTMIRLYLGGMGANTGRTEAIYEGWTRKWLGLWIAVASVACVLLLITGHQGAMLVYDHGAGVHAAGLSSGVSHDDLLTLRRKLDPDSIFYSDQMHHIFGWLILAFSLLLLADALAPQLGERLRLVLPLLLIAGGIFLMIFSDQDSWPLYQVRPYVPVTNKEVLMHKTYATMLLIAGILPLWQWWKRRGQPLAPKANQEMQSLLMTMFALLGGALLFTHVHATAPYANVAAGVYLHHTVIGIFAITIGAIKLTEAGLLRRKREDQPSGFSSASSPVWIEERMPESAPRRSSFQSATAPVVAPLSTPAAPASGRRLARTLAIAYPCLVLVEAILLLNYNEGLPWFLGYRNLSLTAPHRGLIAPLGRDRAELTFDPDTQRLDVYVFDQSSNHPHPITSPTLQAVVKTGSDSTSVTLTPASGNGGRSDHYAGTASFLRGANLFEAQVLDYGKGSHRERPLIADFEPWTDARAARPHSRQAWVCPMEPTEGSDQPGKCPSCGMTLIANRPVRSKDKLHDDGWNMGFVITPSTAEAEAKARQAVQARPTHNHTHHTDVEESHWAYTAVEVRQPYPLMGVGEQSSPAVAPTAGQLVQLTLTPRRPGGQIQSALEVTHTKLMHLIVVSRDLAYFDHVHPHWHEGGSLTLDYRFPRPGAYTLYADITPTGERQQIFALPVTVSGDAPAAEPLIETPAQAVAVGEYRIALAPAPLPLQTRDETALTFTVSRNGIPVNGLEPYLGAGGHCVAISADGSHYLHSHPANSQQSPEAPSPNALPSTAGQTTKATAAPVHYGPSVTFHTQFPHPGLYKVWAQFSHQGKILTAPFVVRVN